MTSCSPLPAPAARLDYVGSISVQADPGLTDVRVLPARDRAGKYNGLQGVLVKGSPNAQFGIGFGLGVASWLEANGRLAPSTLSWSWEATGPNIAGLSSDWDEFTFSDPYVDYGAGWMSSYAWEARRNNANRYQTDPLSCGSSSTVVNPDVTKFAAPVIPFQPGFTKVNNGIVLCGGRVAYYQLNPQNLVMRHCAEATSSVCPGGANRSYSSSFEWSYADVAAYRSDWVLAAAMKALYDHDPLGLTVSLP